MVRILPFLRESQASGWSALIKVFVAFSAPFYDHNSMFIAKTAVEFSWEWWTVEHFPFPSLKSEGILLPRLTSWNWKAEKFFTPRAKVTWSCKKINMKNLLVAVKLSHSLSKCVSKCRQCEICQWHEMMKFFRPLQCVVMFAEIINEKGKTQRAWTSRTHNQAVITAHNHFSFLLFFQEKIDWISSSVNHIKPAHSVHRNWFITTSHSNSH